MERSRFDHEAYLEHRDKIIEVSRHYDDCEEQGRNVPLYACPCTCYQEQIFLLGMKTQKDLFYDGNDRGGE